MPNFVRFVRAVLTIGQKPHFVGDLFFGRNKNTLNNGFI